MWCVLQSFAVEFWFSLFLLPDFIFLLFAHFLTAHTRLLRLQIVEVLVDVFLGLLNNYLHCSFSFLVSSVMSVCCLFLFTVPDGSLLYLMPSAQRRFVLFPSFQYRFSFVSSLKFLATTKTGLGFWAFQLLRHVFLHSGASWLFLRLLFVYCFFIFNVFLVILRYGTYDCCTLE